jgi:hypothetical protein
MTKTSWRDRYKVHPAADVFPMMSDAELAELGEDIKANGLVNKPLFYLDGNAGPILIDGRNRLEAIERLGLKLPLPEDFLATADPVASIISLNIHRRHLTKAQQADMIVAAIKAGAANEPVQDEPVNQGGRTKGGKAKKNTEKEKVFKAAKDAGISEGTAKRAYDKANKPKVKKRVIDALKKKTVANGCTEAEASAAQAKVDELLGRKPKAAKPKVKPKGSTGTVTIPAGIDGARTNYIDELRLLDDDEAWNAEIDRFMDEIRQARRSGGTHAQEEAENAA